MAAFVTIVVIFHPDDGSGTFLRNLGPHTDYPGRWQHNYSCDFRPWRWSCYVPPKRQFTYELHGTRPEYGNNQNFRCDFRPWRWKLYYFETSVHIRTTGTISEDGNSRNCRCDFRPWRWNGYILPKHVFTYGLHGAIPGYVHVHNYRRENLKSYDKSIKSLTGDSH
jgi:hypothetical protein